ncbi:MAG: TVP38/TMEM64 family protein [Deltaproteobacteria bacterium]|nr:TVP38/TMEM64 family protein [Deltaproteobacteria bacterium]
MRGNLKFIIFILLIIAAAVSVRVFGLTDYLDRERLRLWVESFGLWGPIVYILIYSVGPSLMMPGLPITVIGGVLFGPVWGSIYVLLGATIGAGIAFLIARYMGRGWVETIVKESRFRELDKKVEAHGWKIVAFTRLIPLFPYNFLNYAFGLTRVRFLDYLLATFIFMIPGVVAYVVFSSSILDLLKGVLSRQLIIGLILVAIVAIIPFIYKKMRKGERP